MTPGRRCDPPDLPDSWPGPRRRGRARGSHSPSRSGFKSESRALGRSHRPRREFGGARRVFCPTVRDRVGPRSALNRLDFPWRGRPLQCSKLRCQCRVASAAMPAAAHGPRMLSSRSLARPGQRRALTWQPECSLSWRGAPGLPDGPVAPMTRRNGPGSRCDPPDLRVSGPGPGPAGEAAPVAVSVRVGPAPIPRAGLARRART